MHALAVFVDAVAPAFVALHETVRPDGQRVIAPLRIERAAPAAFVVELKSRLVALLTETGLLGKIRGDTAEGRVAEEQGVGAAGELKALGIVAVRVGVKEKVVARGIISAAAGITEVE